MKRSKTRSDKEVLKMKYLYKAPLVTAEELTEKDVLCSSDPDTDSSKFDNAKLFGNSTKANGLGGMSNVL